jgi:hypothetical protein
VLASSGWGAGLPSGLVRLVICGECPVREVVAVRAPLEGGAFAHEHDVQCACGPGGPGEVLEPAVAVDAGKPDRQRVPR